VGFVCLVLSGVFLGLLIRDASSAAAREGPSTRPLDFVYKYLYGSTGALNEIAVLVVFPCILQCL
jgi:hypothetical protein